MRPPGWPEALAAHVDAMRDLPWCWGKRDCVSFARGAVLAVGGPDLGEGWAGAYSDEAGAGDLMLTFGRNLEAAVERVCRSAGLQEVSPLLAQRGDLVVIVDPHLTANLAVAAVCIGAYGATFIRRGFVRLPMRAAVRAWAI
jgi:hypothetical protein